MNESEALSSKAAQSVCARCGSQLSSIGDAETFCVSCLLHAALGGEDVDPTAKLYRFDQYELITNDDGVPVELEIGRASCRERV